MSDRLAHLRRQRTLAQEQLDWINHEIAAAEIGAGPKPNPVAHMPGDVVPPATAASAVVASGVAAKDTTAEGDDLIARYGVAPEALRNDVRKGCFIYFAAALLLLAVGVAILYFALRTP